MAKTAAETEPTTTLVPDSRSTRKGGVARQLNKREAQELTNRIRQQGNELWKLIAEAHDRKAWKALGYETWKDYATTELQISESRSFQLIDTGRVMKAIGQVVDPEALDVVTMTARETQRVKPFLKTFPQQVKQLVKDGLEPAEAVKVAIKNLPEAEKKPRKPKADKGNVIEIDAEGKVTDVPAPTLLLDPVDVSALVQESQADPATMTPVVVPTPFSDAVLAVVRDAAAISELFDQARREQGEDAFAAGVFETLRWLTDKSAAAPLREGE